MLNRNKKAVILICLVIISLNLISKEIPKAKSVDPFFSLVARGTNSRHMDYLNLIKQQLEKIGIHLKLEFYNFTYATPSEFVALRKFDLQIVDFPWNVIDDPFHSLIYTENASLNLAGYDTSLDWDEELGTGINEWYIQTGLQMTPNNSEERLNLCWGWQNYLMDDVLPCLPLFTHKNDSSSLQLLVYNLREVRPVIGERDPCAGFPAKSMGLAIRKAISYAINREEIRRVVLGDDYEISHHPINPTNKTWLNPNGVKYCHDLIAAVGLMKVTSYWGGWTPGPYIGYGPWPDWEDVCAKNLITSSSPGFEVFCVVVVLIVLSQVVLINRLRILKERKANEDGGI